MASTHSGQRCIEGLRLLLDFSLLSPRHAALSQDTRLTPAVKQIQDTEDLESITVEEIENACNEKLAEGDLVIISGLGVPREFQNCSAAVTEVEEAYCSVAVLDPSRSFKVGECSVRFSNVQQVHTDWRIGGRMVIGGLQSCKTRHFNGCTAVICQHRRHGHPCFAPESEAAPPRLKLKLCVQWENPQTAATGAMLIEPRFLFRDLGRVDSDVSLRGQDVPKASMAMPPQQALPSTTLLGNLRRPHVHEESEKLLPGRHQLALPPTSSRWSDVAMQVTDLSSTEREASAEAGAYRPLSAVSCTGGFLGVLGWFVGAHSSTKSEGVAAPSLEDDELLTLCKMASIVSEDSCDSQGSAVDRQQVLHYLPTLETISEHKVASEEASENRAEGCYRETLAVSAALSPAGSACEGPRVESVASSRSESPRDRFGIGEPGFSHGSLEDDCDATSRDEGRWRDDISVAESSVASDLSISLSGRTLSSIYSSSFIEKPQLGDLVILRQGHQFKLNSAVVTSVDAEEGCCMVAVLDASRSYCTGECAASFSQIMPVSTEWRIGTQLMIDGPPGDDTSHLNGLRATVCPHKRHGHPCFLRRADDKLWLMLCVRIEDTAKSNVAAVLLEPRFLSQCSRSPMQQARGNYFSYAQKLPQPIGAEDAPVTFEVSYRKSDSLNSTVSGSSKTSWSTYKKQSSWTSVASTASAYTQACSKSLASKTPGSVSSRGTGFLGSQLSQEEISVQAQHLTESLMERCEKLE